MSTLFLVGTPIGNLGDITLRAIETLKLVDYIACEDTRHSIKLLNHLEIKKPLLSYFKEKEQEKSEELVKLLNDGKNIALISDAGMPVVCDPGAVLVSKARESGHTVTVVPGPSAVISSISLSGKESKGFIFLGFLPEKRKDKEAVLSPFINSTLPLIFYVAPHDMEKTVKFLYESLGDRDAFYAREITKMYEETKDFSLKDYAEEARGEYVLTVYPKPQENSFLNLSAEEHLKQYIDSGMDKKTAVKKVADERGVNKNEIYQLSLKLK